MSIRIIPIIISLICSVCAIGVDRISVSFTETPLPTALRTIEQLASEEVTINFSYRKLEDYTVTTEIIDTSPIEAINQAIGFYPIKITTSGNVVTVQPLLDTVLKICGRLVDEHGDGVDFATVTILTLNQGIVHPIQQADTHQRETRQR